MNKYNYFNQSTLDLSDQFHVATIISHFKYIFDALLCILLVLTGLGRKSGQQEVSLLN